MSSNRGGTNHHELEAIVEIPVLELENYPAFQTFIVPAGLQPTLDRKQQTRTLPIRRPLEPGVGERMPIT
jgi:hypothetical protein